MENDIIVIIIVDVGAFLHCYTWMDKENFKYIFSGLLINELQNNEVFTNEPFVIHLPRIQRNVPKVVKCCIFKTVKILSIICEKMFDQNIEFCDDI